MAVNESNTELNQDMATLTGMAERLGLAEGSEERKSYIHDHLIKLGYEAVPTYRKPEDGGDGKTGGKRGWGF